LCSSAPSDPLGEALPCGREPIPLLSTFSALREGLGATVYLGILIEHPLSRAGRFPPFGRRSSDTWASSALTTCTHPARLSVLGGVGPFSRPRSPCLRHLQVGSTSRQSSFFGSPPFFLIWSRPRCTHTASRKACGLRDTLGGASNAVRQTTCYFNPF
jgi:hypothetical protein